MDFALIIFIFIIFFMFILVIFISFRAKSNEQGLPGATGPPGICLSSNDITYQLDYQNATPINNGLSNWKLPIQINESQIINNLNLSLIPVTDYIFIMLETGMSGQVLKYIKQDNNYNYIFCTKCSQGDDNCRLFNNQCLLDNSQPLFTNINNEAFYYFSNTMYNNILLGANNNVFVYSEN